MRTCTKCKQNKSYECFKKSKINKDGLYSSCKDCERSYRKTRQKEHKQYMNEYYLANKDNLLEYMAEYHKLNKSDRNAYSRKYYKQRRENNLESDMLARCKYRSKKLGIDFNLTLDDIVIPPICPVLGIELKPNKGTKGGSRNSPSIDRIEPKLGYVKGNVRIISNRANTLKCDASVDELELVLEDLKSLKGTD